MNSDDLIYVQHMLDAAGKACAFVQDRTRAALDEDEILALALVRLLEVLGEAARNVSSATRTASPELPWSQLVATRNRLIHGYFDVDLDIVWTIVTVDLPLLLPRLVALEESLRS